MTFTKQVNSQIMECPKEIRLSFLFKERGVILYLQTNKKISVSIRQLVYKKISVSIGMMFITYFELALILSTMSSGICSFSADIAISSNSILPTKAFTNASFPCPHKQTAISPKLFNTAHINNSLYGSSSSFFRPLWNKYKNTLTTNLHL